MEPFKLERMGVIMEPKPGEAMEAEGVLNPAIVRGRDGELYMFPRLVAKGNYSRIGRARVLFDKAGDPVGVERLGVALEPETDYELRPETKQGGCEDPRISFVEPLDHYVMSYVAFGPRGPRIAIARSDDLVTWDRVGLAKFHSYEGISFDGVDDKDSVVFPTLTDDPQGQLSVALLHRPLFPGTRPEEMVERRHSVPADRDLESIWISYWHMKPDGHMPKGREFVAHRRLARPEAAWEKLKIGAGTPPVLCRHGWLALYHGVHEMPESTPERRKLCYSAGLLVLSKDHPHKVLYRSPEPVLVPEADYELKGTVDGVVFPTGIDRRDDIGQPDRFDVYYGMADDRIGVARLIVPETLPQNSA